MLPALGAVDYEARVWVNGDEVGRHRGGHTPFGFDVTDYLKAGDNEVVVRAWDGWLTDVEQEINGLMTYDRKPKADPKQFKRVFAPER